MCTCFGLKMLMHFWDLHKSTFWLFWQFSLVCGGLFFSALVWTLNFGIGCFRPLKGHFMLPETLPRCSQHSQPAQNLFASKMGFTFYNNVSTISDAQEYNLWILLFWIPVHVGSIPRPSTHFQPLLYEALFFVLFFLHAFGIVLILWVLQCDGCFCKYAELENIDALGFFILLFPWGPNDRWHWEGSLSL